MNRKYIFLPCLAALLVVLVALLAQRHGAPFPILDPAGSVAFAERWVIIATVALCAIIVVPVFVLLFYFAWKYRASNPRAAVHHEPDWDHDSVAAEFSWWLAPSAVIIVLGFIMWQSAHQLDPYRSLPSASAPITVQVVALDWKWLFIYPAQGIASVNALTLPVGVPVHFELTADAPMNSFWIPALGGQIMVMPGMQTQLNLVADRPGTYNGFSANISGDGFAGMAFTAQAVSQSDFDAWAANLEDSTSTPLNATSYAALAAPSEYNAASYYAPIDPELYTSAIMKYMTPASGAPMAMPGMAMLP